MSPMNGAPGLTRRTLLTASAMLGLMPNFAAKAQQTGVLKATGLNHVNLQVANLTTASQFYQRVFGMGALRTVLPPGIAAYGVDFGGVMLTLHQRAKGGISDHYGIGFKGFQPRRDGDALRAAGFPARGASDEYVFVPDPDGIPVQISDIRYTAVCDYCEPPNVPPFVKPTPLLQARGFKYINLKVADLGRSITFYRNALGLPPARLIKQRSGKAAAIDVGSSFLLLEEDAGATIRIDHFGIAVDNLDLKQDEKKLRSAGMTLEDARGILMIRGTDGERIGIADSAWTG